MKNEDEGGGCVVVWCVLPLRQKILMITKS